MVGVFNCRFAVGRVFGSHFCLSAMPNFIIFSNVVGNILMASFFSASTNRIIDWVNHSECLHSWLATFASVQLY